MKSALAAATPSDAAMSEDEALAVRALFRADVLDGLSLEQKALPCKWLYDAKGSAIFEEICSTPEYYVTRTELALLADVVGDVAKVIGPKADVLEPGSGAGRKIRALLSALPSPASFTPIDISRDALVASLPALASDFPHLDVRPLVCDFTQPFELPDEFYTGRQGKRLVFFPGSTISNFGGEEARHFLVRLKALLRPSDFLFIGVDLVKDVGVLERAYDDAAGVTARFNLNLLDRISRELTSDIDSTTFRHVARYNAECTRIEMHLESTRDQLVNVDGHAFSFRSGETIHTENSYKFTVDGFRELASSAGFPTGTSYVDDRKFFSLHLLKAS